MSKKHKKSKKQKVESESEESEKQEKKSKWVKFLKDDGDFEGWRKTAQSLLKSKNGKMKKNKMLKKIWKIY